MEILRQQKMPSDDGEASGPVGSPSLRNYPGKFSSTKIRTGSYLHKAN